MYDPWPTTQVSAANTSPTTVGIADWNTIAPVMLPSASVSLFCRTQMIELNFSGSSVAIGRDDQCEQDLADPERVRDAT